VRQAADEIVNDVELFIELLNWKLRRNFDFLADLANIRFHLRIDCFLTRRRESTGIFTFEYIKKENSTLAIVHFPRSTPFSFSSCHGSSL